MAIQENEERKRHLLSYYYGLHKTFMFILICVICEYQRSLMNKRSYGVKPSGEAYESRKRVRDESVNEIMTNETSKDIIRMSNSAFEKLCLILREETELQSTQRTSIEEQVAKFLHILAHDERNRSISFFFRRSKKSTSSHFHKVLRSIISLEDRFLKQPSREEVCPEILTNPRFYPYFKDCIGAVDGTHVRVRVSREDVPRYRGRKMHPTMNIMAACTFDLKFTYVLTGWEGTAADSRIIKDALKRHDKLQIPNGKYYLVDAEFPHYMGLMTPHRATRYHLKEYSSRPPENGRELFNLRHASLRNAIERAFGVLKKRFPIIGSTTEPYFSPETQSQIVLACCILHNYIMSVDGIDEGTLNEVDRELEQEDHNDDTEEEPGNDDMENETNAIYFRNYISSNMWNDYVDQEYYDNL